MSQSKLQMAIFRSTSRQLSAELARELITRADPVAEQVLMHSASVRRDMNEL